MFRYQRKKGAETRIFAGARNLESGIVESDEPLNTPYLELIESKPEQMTASPATPPQAAPVSQPVPPANPPVIPPQDTQTANKEAI